MSAFFVRFSFENDKLLADFRVLSSCRMRLRNLYTFSPFERPGMIQFRENDKFSAVFPETYCVSLAALCTGENLFSSSFPSVPPSFSLSFLLSLNSTSIIPSFPSLPLSISLSLPIHERIIHNRPLLPYSIFKFERKKEKLKSQTGGLLIVHRTRLTIHQISDR